MKFKFLNMDNESGFILIEKELERLNVTAQVKEDGIELKGKNTEQARIYLQTLFNSNIVELDDHQKKRKRCNRALEIFRFKNGGG